MKWARRVNYVSRLQSSLHFRINSCQTIVLDVFAFVQTLEEVLMPYAHTQFHPLLHVNFNAFVKGSYYSCKP